MGKRSLNGSFSKERFGLPLIVADSCCFAISASRATAVPNVVCSSSATPAFYVDNFALAFAH
jgi:hypothetical protein